MTSSRPYLIRAMYEWIVDNGMTPYLLVLADREGVRVPDEFVEENRIVLNISPVAVRNLVLGNEAVTFSGRFGGRPMEIVIPVHAAAAIYARENGKGMVFKPEDDGPEPEDGAGGAGGVSKLRPKRPSLKVVK